MLGGVDISWRAHIWKYLFNIYPFNSTDRYYSLSCYKLCYGREQRTIDLENRARYKALHERWVVLDKTVNLPDEEPSSDPLEYLMSSDDEGTNEKSENAQSNSFL